ncbi:hypothetical protein [Melaminivora sp.]
MATATPTPTPKNQRLADFLAHAGSGAQRHFSVSRSGAVQPNTLECDFARALDDADHTAGFAGCA